MQVASCDARPRTRESRTRDPPVPGAGARTTRQLARTSSNSKSRKKPRVFAPQPRRSPQRVARAPQRSQKTSSFCTSTTPIPAEGRASRLNIAKKHGFLHLDHADSRRGSREQVKHPKKPRVFAPRPRRFPQRVRAGTLEIAKNLEFLHLDHADPRRGLREHRRNRKKTMGFCTSTTPIPAEGRASRLNIAKNHGFLHLDHADPRRGSIFV